jgi:hypothetical protein
VTLPAEKPPLIVWDIIVSIVMWVLSVGLIGVAAFVALFGLAFIDYCPPESCSAQGAFLSLMVAGVASIFLLLTGLTWGIVRIVERQTSWWVGLGALVLSLACWIIGFVGAAKSVGW